MTKIQEAIWDWERTAMKRAIEQDWIFEMQTIMSVSKALCLADERGDFDDETEAGLAKKIPDIAIRLNNYCLINEIIEPEPEEDLSNAEEWDEWDEWADKMETILYDIIGRG